MCKECGINPVYEFTNQRKLCKNCYVRWFEKKFLYTVRKFDMFSKGDVIGFKKGRDLQSVVLENLLKMYSSKAFVEIVFSTSKKANKFVLADTTSSISFDFVDGLVEADVSKLKLKPVEGKFVRPLYLFLDKEVLLYAKIKGLKFKEKKISSDKLREFFNSLEKKHPEIEQAVVQSYLGLFF